MRFLFWGFKSPRELFDGALGALERDVMALAWTRPEVSVRDACERLGSSVAYTTVMTTMDRLFKKGLLARRMVGRAFVYRAAATQQEIENAVLSSLVDVVSERDRAMLDELERLVREKRRALEGKKPR